MEPNRDQLSIETPELVSISMPLAGIGSRFIAIFIDYLIWAAVAIVLSILAAIVLPGLALFARVSANWAAGIYILSLFFMQWGYFTLFEALDNGRTPGKHIAKIRVIHRSGRAISFVESLARNLVRVVDYLPGLYAVGLISIFVSRQNQRLGDMVAGTLVVRDRPVESPHWGELGSRTITAPALASSAADASPGDRLRTPPHLHVVLPASEIAKLSASDLEVLESFFARRLDMSLETRAMLAQRIAAAIHAKSGLAIPADTTVETFLEAVAHHMRELGSSR